MKIAVIRSIKFKAQNGLCYYCESRMWQKKSRKGMPSALQCTAEHLIARSEGGKNSTSNIVAACAFCNFKRHQRKHPPEPDAYKAFVKKRLSKGRWNLSMAQRAL